MLNREYHQMFPQENRITSISMMEKEQSFQSSLFSDVSVLCGVIFLVCLMHIVLKIKECWVQKWCFALLIVYISHHLNHKLTHCPLADVEIMIQRISNLTFPWLHAPCIFCDITLEWMSRSWSQNWCASIPGWIINYIHRGTKLYINFQNFNNSVHS